ncbi:cytochrome c oxidase subunit 4 isoform 1, mitochondrial-like [Anthonomus grandis grandis]|uniref:cytochrome c oxidase subunit 4 isoform 1, mitochondrial-like n=1 Tax=Anthonomus grandis grandis TaxID=2921223 RepID=UPI00216542BE|nr:cytochrome c oxidase subunit 4 isoform 1, mitochondrial-like [Anthonomus grandis grandis]
MANTMLALTTRHLIKNVITKTAVTQSAAMSGTGGSFTKKLIGKREIVGFGWNGEPSYGDRTDFPFPAIRWKEPNADILALREKEKGDWKNLSIEEKKALYRASFRQTFAEMKAPTGEWKYSIGVTLLFCAVSLWCFFGMKAFVYPPLPESFKQDHREAQARRMIDLHVNPVQGISSKWDYEKDDWKK